MKSLKKSMIFIIIILLYICLSIFIKDIGSSITFLQVNYVKVIAYFIYFIFLFMIIFFYLKQFNLYTYMRSFLIKDNKENYIIKITEDDNSEWKNIILNIESTRHISILSKIKDLDTETEINIPKYNYKYDFNIVFLHKVREFIVLFENILEKLKHRDLDENSKENEKSKTFIQNKLYELYLYKYLFKVKLIFIKLIYYLIPYAILLLSLNIVNDPNMEYEAFLNFFLGLGILVFSMPVLLLINNIIQFLKILLFKELDMSFSKSLLLDVSIQIVITLAITIIMLWGFSKLDNPTASTHIFHDIFVFFKDMVFSTEIIIDGKLSKTYSFFIEPKENVTVSNFILIAKIIIGIMGTIIMLNIMSIFVKDYDQFFYEQKIKRYLLPPELLKVLSFFFIFIIYLTYTYIMVSAYPYDKSNIKPSISYSEEISIDNNRIQFIAIDKIAKAIEEKASFEDILPFGLFLALFGTLLSISSRDIMANYFAGLSMKMNHPYEQGDRVKIENSEILEVQEIGIRNDKFYEISSNSIISIPHTKLAASSIKNYTYPTLDYRKQLTIYIKAENENSSPREAEKVLLVSAFINTGVKLPRIDQKIIDAIEKSEIRFDIFKDYKDKDHVIIEKDLNTKKNEIIDKINDTWDELSKINRTVLNDNKKKYFFKNIFIERLPIDNLPRDTSDRTILSVKKALIAIITSVIDYQSKIKSNFSCKSDKNGIRRKYMIFDGKDEKIKEFADILVDISFYYYMLANRLWELKEEQTTFSQKRKIDRAMTQILNVPRVSSIQELSDDANYWKTTLFVTLELSEQGDETLHHINMYIDKIWDIFFKKG